MIILVRQKHCYSSILVVFSQKINFFQETKKEIIIIIRENED